MSSGPQDLFPSTHWSLVARAGHDDTDVRRDALSELVRKYLPPLRIHLIGRRGIDPHEADDLLQMFLVSQVLEKDLIERADPGRGRFRNYLLKAVERFVANSVREQPAIKRGLERVEPLERGPLPIDPRPTPAESCEVAWAREVLERALLRMRNECEKSERPDIWGVFEGRVLAAAVESSKPVEYEELAIRFGFDSIAQAANVLVTAKRMFARALRSVVGEYEKDEADIDAEIAELWAALSLGGSSTVGRD
jgi:RNA polymerase sigma-70 factor (ECF subfamily)